MTEVILHYNAIDEKYYLYLGESFVEWYSDEKEAIEGFRKAISLRKNMSDGEIRAEFGWKNAR